MRNRVRIRSSLWPVRRDRVQDPRTRSRVRARGYSVRRVRSCATPFPRRNEQARRIFAANPGVYQSGVHAPGDASASSGDVCRAAAAVSGAQIDPCSRRAAGRRGSRGGKRRVRPPDESGLPRRRSQPRASIRHAPVDNGSRPTAGNGRAIAGRSTPSPHALVRTSSRRKEHHQAGMRAAPGQRRIRTSMIQPARQVEPTHTGCR